MNKGDVGFAVFIIGLFAFAFFFGFSGVVGHNVQEVDPLSREIVGYHALTWSEVLFGGCFTVFMVGCVVVLFWLVFVPWHQNYLKKGKSGKGVKS